MPLPTGRPAPNPVHVPLNDELAAIDPNQEDSGEAWNRYVARWLPWSHVHTFATLAASASFLPALDSMH